MTLKPKDRKPPELGPAVRVAAARLLPDGNDSKLAALTNNEGLSDSDKNGFKEHGTAPGTMWLAPCAPETALEFELPEPVALSAIEVWNYNAEWQTTNGLHTADIAVSADGNSWQTVLPKFEFAEADGRPDYDTPVLLNLKGVTARKVRFNNVSTWGGAKVGLSKVVFHEVVGTHAAVSAPQGGAAR